MDRGAWRAIYSLWVCQELDTTEWLTHTHTQPAHKQMFYFHNGAEKSAFTITERRSKWQPTPVFLPGKSHGRRSLVGYRPQGRKESDTNERDLLLHKWTEGKKRPLSMPTICTHCNCDIKHSVLWRTDLWLPRRKGWGRADLELEISRYKWL